MASLRWGYGPPARPWDGYRSRKSEDGMSRISIPRPANQSGSKGPEISRSGRHIPSPPRSINRNSQIPGPPASVPSRPSQESYSDSQNRPAHASGGSTSPETSRSHIPTGSGSSSSSRSFESTSRAAQALHKRARPPVLRGPVSSHTGSRNTGSASSASRSQDVSDPGLGIQFDRGMTESPAEIQVGEVADIQTALAQPPIIYPELDRYRDFHRPDYSLGRHEIEVPYRLATHDLPPPTPGSLWFSGSSQVSAVSESPSTKFSGSPGPGPYSRDTTPTSISSQSPVSVASSRVGVPFRNMRQHGTLTTRPPVTRRRAGSFPNELEIGAVDLNGLASVRESLTSSSSNSTVKDSDWTARKEKTKGSKLPPPPPSPPLRKSSQKFHQNKGNNDYTKTPGAQQNHTKDISAKPRNLHNTTVSPPTQTSTQKSPPARPSRQNTPDMKSQLFTATPVIQSNLLTTTRPVETRGSDNVLLGSTSHPGSTISISQNRKVASTSNLPALGSDKSVASTISQPSTKRQQRSVTGNSIPSQTSEANTRSSSRTRFPFFGRKKLSSNSPIKLDDIIEKKTAVRKGPVAGTGHEGYGRVGAVRRRSGSGPALPQNVMDPQSSYDSLSSSDSFLADRMNPVIISGGEVIENRNTSSEISRPEASARPSTDSRLVSEDLSATRNISRSPLGTCSQPHGQSNSPRQPSDGSGTDGVCRESTLAFRRSVQRLRSSPDNPLRLPRPIITSGHASPSSPLTSFDTDILSDESHIELQRDLSADLGLSQAGLKKLQKKERSPRKWNLFSRSRNQSDAKKGKKNEQVAATVTAVGKRPVAFYTIIDAAEQEVATEHANIQEVLRDADVYTQTANTGTSSDSFLAFQQSSTSEDHDWAPQQPWQPPSDNMSITTIASSSAADSSHSVIAGRPSRLQQVGRIPQVKKFKEVPLPQSFSRPFGASLHLPAKTAIEVYDPEFVATGSTPTKVTTPVRERSIDGPTLESGNNPSHNLLPSSKVSSDIGIGGKEFLSFSPRKNSNGTIYTSSSSSGAANLFATATAVIPRPEDPPVEDEVWDEYNDLLGEEAVKGPQSATSSKGTPFHLETYQNKLAKEKALDSPIILSDNRRTSTCSEAPTNSTCISADMTERIQTAPQPKPSSTAVQPPAAALTEVSQNESQSHTFVDSKLKRTSCSSCHTAFSDCSACSSNDGTPLAQVNLRVGSMTVSKWLTFGHVLFSDVRHQLAPVKSCLKTHSILVIDGLGNDDWSFYAAETYPSASFFNLSPRAPLPAELNNSPSGFPLSPPNHHQVQYTSHLDKFPFAPQSFDAVVYRFPTVAPELYYWNILIEARRVLRPDGYIELSILDSDLNNMGNRGRRTVRSLKERIRLQSPDTSFASTADLIVRLLGKAGFTSIKAARVGVPVASSIARAGSLRSKDKSYSLKEKYPPSLAEMMSDSSPLADENITKIVTRVGRWWYTRCYESPPGLKQEKSIWNDRSLLSECEQLGTSLKLMVCCARAPDRITSF